MRKFNVHDSRYNGEASEVIADRFEVEKFKVTDCYAYRTATFYRGDDEVAYFRDPRSITEVVEEDVEV